MNKGNFGCPHAGLRSEVGECDRWRSVQSPARLIGSLLEVTEKGLEKGMANHAELDVGLEVPLRDVGRVFGSVGQYVIPGLLTRRTGAGNQLIPLLRAAEG